MSSGNIHKYSRLTPSWRRKDQDISTKLILDLGKQKAQDFCLVEPWAATVLCSLAQSYFFFSISWSPLLLLLDLSSLRNGIGPRFSCLQGSLKVIWICLEMLMNFLEGKDSGCYGICGIQVPKSKSLSFPVPEGLDSTDVVWEKFIMKLRG